MSALTVFFYLSLLTGAWGVLFHKRFEQALAPALFSQTLFIQLSGMLFQSLSVGIWAGGLVAAIIWILQIFRKNLRSGLKNQYSISQKQPGFLLFIILFLFIWLTNTGKYFIFRDEYSHWGIFIKECLRTDQLYCDSLLPITHKDYVPAATLFEVLLMLLTRRFLEADAYRAM